MRGLKFGAIIVGAVVDIAVTMILSIPFAMVLLGIYMAQGMTMLQAQQGLQKDAHTLLMLFASAGVGGLGSLAGGFVAGWMARTHRVVNGAAAGIVSTLFGLMFGGQDPLWFNLMGTVITIGLQASGAYLAQVVFGPEPARPTPPILVHP